MRRVSDQDEAAIAQRLGLDAYAFSEQEENFVPVDTDEGAYCLIRNHILTKWRLDVTRPLTEDRACSEIEDRYRGLARLAFRFLNRHGFINFGLLAQPPKQWPARSKRSVVIVGAGLAGLAAARQLQASGHQVVVVEGRARAGGRVHSSRLEQLATLGVGELGGSVLTGVDGNPLAVIARQLGESMHTIGMRCPLYMADGLPVPADIDEKVEQQFNSLLDACNTYRADIGPAADMISLGRALEQLSLEQGVATKCRTERALLDWHFANLEYANAGLLAALSLGQWDQDDPFEMSGDHCLLPGGNSRLVAALCTGVPVFYNCRVEHIAHGTSGAVVTCIVDDGGGPAKKREFRADLALVTLPLGVLKREAVTFEPSLPPRKLAAIQALGFGTLNKCVMLFPAPFWDTGLDTFGRVATSQGARGELFLFYSYVHLCGAAGAVLIGLVAGESAEAFESVDSAEAQRLCVEALQSIFGPRGVDVPQPVAFVRTAWAADPYARGSYSNVQVGASGDDYDEMASPVGDRLFFAGEATCRTHPATMHGAFMSGLREAARIADWRPSGGPPGGGASWGATHAEDAATPFEVAAPQPHARSDFNPEVVHRHLVAAFTRADWEFGAFALVLHPKDESPEAPALVRVDLPRALDAGAGRRTLPVFLRLRRGDALALRDCPGGDAERLALLSGMKGGDLSGRKQDLGADAFALAALRAAECTPP